MSNKVNEIFKENYAEVIALIITDIQLENTFEASLEKQQIQKRQAETAIEQQKIDKLEGEISVIKSEYDTKVQRITAQAKREADVLKEKATSQGVSSQINAMRAGYREMQTSGLGMAAAEVVQYHFYRRMRIDKTDGINVYVAPDATVTLTETWGWDD